MTREERVPLVRSKCVKCGLRIDVPDVASLMAENERLRGLGDGLASAVERRWSGPNGCDCECCAAAKAWRVAATRRTEGA